ncbi:MAG: hypothetical protein ACRCX2_30750 [Paraclostridium sp.]
MLENEKKKSMLDSIRGELNKEEVKAEETKAEEVGVSEKTLRNRARRQKRKQQQINKSIPKEATINVVPDSERLVKLSNFKNKYIESEINKEFLDMLESANSSNDEAFSEDEFLEAKMNNSSARVVILDPSVDDISLGKGYKWFVVRPLFVNEYMDFIKKFGPRETKPQEFLEYCFKKCLILPKMTDEQKDDVPSGTILTLYRTILDISDFNKNYRIIEV